MRDEEQAGGIHVRQEEQRDTCPHQHHNDSTMAQRKGDYLLPTATRTHLALAIV